MRSKQIFCAAIVAAVLVWLMMPMASHADGGLPDAVQKRVQAPLSPVGSSTYRKFGFSVYRATLWAPGGTWDAAKPYALELKYLRSVSKETMVDTVTDNIRDQNVADDATLTKWSKVLNNALPAVEDGDTIIGLAMPGKQSLLFYNGTQTASIEDQAFSKAFFNIWLGDTADEDMRTKLLAQREQD